MNMKEYIKENWDGWPLHSLIAAVVITAGYLHPMETLLGINTYFWPQREATQHDGWGDIWTFHRIMEWGCPVLVGAICYGVLR